MASCHLDSAPLSPKKFTWLIQYDGATAVEAAGLNRALGEEWVHRVDTVLLRGGHQFLSLLHLRRAVETLELERVLRSLVFARVFRFGGVDVEVCNPFEASAYVDIAEIDEDVTHGGTATVVRHLRAWEQRDASAWKRGGTVLFPFKNILY